MIKFIAYIVIAIAAAVVVALLILNRKRGDGKQRTIYIILILALIVLFITIPESFHQVETGTVAVVRHLGKITGMRLPGTYFDFHLTNTYEIFDTKVQQDKINTSAYSKDGQTMELEVFLQYQLQTENVVKIASEYGSLDALQARIETVTIEKTKSVMSSAEAMTIVQNRSKFSNDVSNAVRDGISEDYYVHVKDVVLTNIDFTDEFEKSVEDKVIAEQQKQASITQAEAQLEVSKLEAQKKITEAKGNAEAQKIIAGGIAEANALKVIELAETLGYTINISYTYSITNEKTIGGEYIVEKSEETTKEKVSEITYTNTYIEDGVTVNETKTITLEQTNYVIDTTSGPGSEQFKVIVEDYLQYLAYLDKWNGELPQVVSGTDGINILIPQT